MIKYLECPDLHVAPEWLDVSKLIFSSIIKAAREQEVDFVLLPGDLYDRAIYNSDKGGMPDIIDFIQSLVEICPVAAIYGTRSHDYPGSYFPLQKVGLTILKPGKAYGYENKKIMEMGIYDPLNQPIKPRCLLFGIPEPSKEVYQSKHAEISADKVNREILKAIDHIIIEEIAPMRAMHPNIPAIGMYHGPVTDANDLNAETNEAVKRSDIVVRTESLARAGLTRWALGHIHQPWESKKINSGYAGYAGIDRAPWGNLGFVPSINCVTVNDDQTTSIERIPYGTPMRVKITEPLSAYDPNIAYWLTDSPFPIMEMVGANPWSRITCAEVSEISRRVDSSVIEAATTLPDMAKLFDPEITESRIEKIQEIERSVRRPVLAHRDVKVKSIEITGAKFWGGKTISINIEALPEGLNQLNGSNGSGKSSLAGFCTPYPGMIGKDTESGRASAIKDFFIESESGIKKTIEFNGELHEHLITIRGANTKTPKVECYLTINGKPKLEKGTFDDMAQECERIYGPISDYLATSFYVQPLQGKTESGLMTANMSTVRDLVLNIAGIDYTTEKDFALEKIRSLDKTISDEKISIEAIEKEIPIKDDVQLNIDSNKEELNKLQSQRLNCEASVGLSEALYNTKKIQFDRAEQDRKRKKDLKKKYMDNWEFRKESKKTAQSLKQTIENSDMFRAALESDSQVKNRFNEAQLEWSAVQERNRAIKNTFSEKVLRLATIDQEIKKLKDNAANEYQKALNEWQAMEYKIDAIESRNLARTREIESIKKPCPQCGYIDPDILTKISDLEKAIKNVPDRSGHPIPSDTKISPELLTERDRLKIEINVPLKLEEFDLPSSGLGDDKVKEYRSKIDEAISAEARVKSIEEEIIPQREAMIIELQKEISEIKIEDVSIYEESSALAIAKEALKNAEQSIANIKAEIETQVKLLADIDKRREAIIARRVENDNRSVDLEDWKYIDNMLSPSKMPAMELEVFLDSIDAEATRQILPYRNGIYIFKTITQKEGQKNTVDKFDIRVHDSETGLERSLLQYSVGEKSFMSDAYIKSLIKVRRLRTKTSYSPIILDEADSFIEIPSIPSFYEMQKNYYSNESIKVIIVSHSPDAANYLQNQIEIKELIHG